MPRRTPPGTFRSPLRSVTRQMPRPTSRNACGGGGDGGSGDGDRGRGGSDGGAGGGGKGMSK